MKKSSKEKAQPAAEAANPRSKTLAVDTNRVNEDGGTVIRGIGRCCLWGLAAQLQHYVRNKKP